MERQLPKNVRQIGNVSDEPKIYVEDYVDTYLNQLKDKAKDEPVGIALAGEILVLEGQPVVYISGAFRLAEVEVRGKEISLKEETVKQMETDRKKYFPETEIVGWGLIEDGKPMGRPGGRTDPQQILFQGSVCLHMEGFPGRRRSFLCV